MGFLFTEIATSRLVLRSLRIEDADAFLAYRSKPEVAEYQAWKPRVKREILRFITRQKRIEPGTPNTWMQLAVCRKKTAEMIAVFISNVMVLFVKKICFTS